MVGVPSPPLRRPSPTVVWQGALLGEAKRRRVEGGVDEFSEPDSGRPLFLVGVDCGSGSMRPSSVGVEEDRVLIWLFRPLLGVEAGDLLLFD